MHIVSYCQLFVVLSEAGILKVTLCFNFVLQVSRSFVTLRRNCIGCGVSDSVRLRPPSALDLWLQYLFPLIKFLSSRTLTPAILVVVVVDSRAFVVVPTTAPHPLSSLRHWEMRRFPLLTVFTLIPFVFIQGIPSKERIIRRYTLCGKCVYFCFLFFPPQSGQICIIITVPLNSNINLLKYVQYLSNSGIFAKSTYL